MPNHRRNSLPSPTSTNSSSIAAKEEGLSAPVAPTTRRRSRMVRANSSIQDSPPETLVVLFKIISPRSWDELHRWHEALPGSRVEHLLYGMYVLIIPQGGTRELAE